MTELLINHPFLMLSRAVTRTAIKDGFFYMLTYYEQLNHPNWIKKRDEIMKRDNFSCTICGCNTKILQVHHLCYFPDTHLWEYDDELMQTVCRQHHEELTYLLPKVSGLISWQCLKNNIDLTTVIELLKRL